MHAIIWGGWRKKASGPITCGVCGHAVVSVSVSFQSDLEHQAQHSKTVVETCTVSNVCFLFFFFVK